MNKNLLVSLLAVITLPACIFVMTTHVYADNSQLELDDTMLNEKKTNNQVGNTKEYTTIPDLFLSDRNQANEKQKQKEMENVSNAKKEVFTKVLIPKKNNHLVKAKEAVFPQSWKLSSEPISTKTAPQDQKNRWIKISTVFLILILAIGISWGGIKIGKRYAHQIRKVGTHG